MMPRKPTVSELSEAVRQLARQVSELEAGLAAAHTRLDKAGRAFISLRDRLDHVELSRSLTPAAELPRPARGRKAVHHAAR